MDRNHCHCIVRGSINKDEYFYVASIARSGETIYSKDHKVLVGGKGANQAVAIARAGGTVRFYGTIGQDGLWVRDEMSRLGIDVNGIAVSEDVTGRAIIQVSDDGENSIVLVPGANHNEHHENVFSLHSINSWFPQSTHLLLQNEINIRSTWYALENSRGAVTILNPSPLPEPKQILEFPWHRVDWLIINEVEARGLYYSVSDGQKGLQKNVTLSTRELIALLSAHTSFQTTNIICTLGADGVIAFIPTFHRPRGAHEAPSFMHIPALKLYGDVRDSTGAGDCFTGYLVQGLMEYGPYARIGKDIREHDIARILKTCVCAAGMCVERKGTIDSIPMRAEVEVRLSTAVVVE